MKKVLLFFVVIVIVVGTMNSCKNDKKSVTKTELSKKEKLLIDAKNGLKTYIAERARNPKTFECSDMHVSYSSDSACVIKFRFIAENAFGGHFNGKAQWIWLNYNGDTYQSWQDTSEDDIFEFGDLYLCKDGSLQYMKTFNLCYDVAETDPYARSLLLNNDILSLSNSYGVLYCIVMTVGEKVKEKPKTEISSLKTW